jgi:hypothetical protein
LTAFTMLWCALFAAGIAAVFQERERRKLMRMNASLCESVSFAAALIRQQTDAYVAMRGERNDAVASEHEKDIELDIYRSESCLVLAPAGLVRSKGGEC